MDKLIFQSSFLLFVTSNNYNAWMTCSGISPLGHMYSKTTSIHDQGTQNLVPEKCSHNLCRQVERELRHVLQIDVAVFRKSESKTL